MPPSDVLDNPVQKDVIDVDALPEIGSHSSPESPPLRRTENSSDPKFNDHVKTGVEKPFPSLCEGLHVELPPGIEAHTAYPFALHQQLGDLWDYSVTGGKMTLKARGCTKISMGPSSTCKECKHLAQNGHLSGILDRMRDGVHENAPFAYHGTGGLITIAREKANRVIALRLRSLNDARKIVSKSGALDDYKEWVMAVGSGKVERVERLVRNAIAQKRGIRGIAQMYADADEAVYPTRKYNDNDRDRGILLWRLGGARVAEIVHKSLALPSLRSLRRMSVMPPLISSTGHPTILDVEVNTKASMSMIWDLLDKIPGKLHQSLLYDEINVNERVRWDEKTNNIVGICREHGDDASLSFTSKHEADLLFEKVLNGDVHLATNVSFIWRPFLG